MMIQNPSGAIKMVTGAYDVVTNYGRPAHAMRAKGSGTITITDGEGNDSIVDVNDGELVVCVIKAITAISGVTGVRLHIPKKYGTSGSYGGGA